MKTSPIKAIPTNVITGFLGVGKSSAILHLLKHKPQDERWAVLVNEFGEVGIDGELLNKTGSNTENVFVREVPGGCMCCTSGLPMQMALNMLIATAKPDRLLIEPTGLGHPSEVLSTLSSQYFQDVIQLGPTLTLVDARKIVDSRYTSHATFLEQLDIADILVANKADLYKENDFLNLQNFISERFGSGSKALYKVSQAFVLPSWLTNGKFDADRRSKFEQASVELAEHIDEALPQSIDFPECGFISKDNSGEGFVSKGWIFRSDKVFQAKPLLALLSGLDVERLKGVFISESETIGVNMVDGILTQTPLETLEQSRIEVIARSSNVLRQIESGLLSCIAAPS